MTRIADLCRGSLEYDFGSCERSIGGVSALKKARLDLVGEYVILVSAM